MICSSNSLTHDHGLPTISWKHPLSWTQSWEHFRSVCEDYFVTKSGQADFTELLCPAGSQVIKSFLIYRTSKDHNSIGNLADRSKMLQPWHNTIHVTTSLLSLVGTVWSIVSKSGRLGEKSLSWQHVLCSCNRITKWHIVNRDFLQETLKAKKSKTLVSAEGL